MSLKFDGKTLQLKDLGDGLAELVFDAKDDSVNKFSAQTLTELRQAVDQLKGHSGLKGLLCSSAKDVFIVGADVTEFLSHFKRTEAELTQWLLETDRLFSDIEDLECPSVTAINGFCLGGGFEFALSTSYRVASSAARIGLPETKLGIFPGWGGTVRLSRLGGADNAIEWIAGGEQYKPEEGLKIGAVDGVTAPEKLREAALNTLKEAVAGRLDWKKRRSLKKGPLSLNAIEGGLAFETAKAFVFGKAGPNYPAPIAAIEVMQKGATQNRDDALKIEAAAFARIAKSPAAECLVGIFLADQLVKKNAKKMSKGAKPPEAAGVLGAGIMGGGIAYTSASKGIATLMKDISEKQLALGMSEAMKIMGKQVERGKMTPAKMAETTARIRPMLTYGDFAASDFVVEAIVENEAVKKKVLPEVESHLKEGTILASNTSTISITRLASVLKRPEKFCGMHFFNPVHRMPLVEIIRGEKTSDETIATAVAYSTAMGKTAVVVNDCPGFLVNRVLFPYFSGFAELIGDGVDFKVIDKTMEKFGWPMGPAYLLDVVGIDTGVHADTVMAAGYPDRMTHKGKTPMDVMVEAKRFGQKNGTGFYKYTPDKKGPPKKEMDPSTYDLIKPCIRANKSAEINDQEIVERMMIPMIFESVRCLEDKIAASPIDIDISMLYGLGFPPFRGGPMKYADMTGLDVLAKAGEKYAARGLGKLYEPPKLLLEMAKAGKKFYPS